MSDLTARRPAFDGQNLFFLAVLGLLSGSSRVRSVLERHGRPPGNAPAPALSTIDPDPALALALGVVALRERLLAHVSAGLGSTPRAAAGAASDASSIGLRTLLR